MSDANHTYKFNITMTCGGCSGAVDRVLKKLDGKSPLATTAHKLLPLLLLSKRILDCSLETDKTFLCCPGVQSYEVSLENQNATVVAGPDLSYEKVLQTITKTGKKVTAGEADGVAQSIEVPSA